MTRLSRCRGGCGLLVATASGRCAACRRAWEKAYDAGRPAHHAIYRTSAWKRLSLEVRQAETRCRWCLRPLPLSKRVADHIIPLEQRPDLAYDRNNLAVADAGCNRRRGHWAKVPDPEAVPVPVAAPREPLSVGARMGAILEAAEPITSPGRARAPESVSAPARAVIPPGISTDGRTPARLGRTIHPPTRGATP